MAEPQSLQFLDELRFKSGKKIIPRPGFRSEIALAIDRHYGMVSADPGGPLASLASSLGDQGMEFISFSDQQRNIDARREMEAELLQKSKATPAVQIVASMTGIIAQSLIRRLCSCRKPIPVTPEFTAQLLQCGVASPPRQRYTAIGCDECDLTGYRGRIGIDEMLVLDDSIRSAIRDGGRSDTVRALARAKGMRRMHEYALEHVIQGLTTLEEVRRVVPLEQVAAVNCASCLRELSSSFAFCPYSGEKRSAQEIVSPPQTAIELGVVNK
jgi:hypothetical protein